jgi:small subunit ribosomal protein S18
MRKQTAQKSDQRGGARGASGRPGQFGMNQRQKRDLTKKKVDPLKLRGISHVDYRDIRILERFLNDRGKILPNRITGLSAANQRKVETAIKHARQLALLPFVAEGMK